MSRPLRRRTRPLVAARDRFASCTLAAAAAAALALGGLGAADARAAAVTVQGEAATATNIPTAVSPEAAGGAYLALDTGASPPAGGWRATYEVTVPAAGVYRLDAVLTSPAMPDRRPFGGSPFALSVNGAPFAEVARSEPHWAGHCETPPADAPPAGTCDVWMASAPMWGALIDAGLGDVELEAGVNTIAFRVDRRRVSASPQYDEPRGAPAPAPYRFLLDELTVTPTDLAVAAAFVGDPAESLGVYRDGRAQLTLRLNGRGASAQDVDWAVVDYFGATVASGTATVAAGQRDAVVRLPRLRPGSYRVTASLSAAPEAAATGHFARLPRRQPVDAARSRFGVTTSSPWLVPASRFDAFASALADMGAGHVREEISWPLAEVAPTAYDTAAMDAAARAFREHGLRVLGAWWNISGSAGAEAPAWAQSETSFPLPDDLRDGYRFARHLGEQVDGVGTEALELWNEPDLDDTRSTGDQHAAYLKAAALGVSDASDRPLVALPGVGAWSGAFHDLMVQNDVARYADAWAYHVYAFPYMPGELTPFPREDQTDVQHSLIRRYGAAIPQTWATEAGLFVPQPEAGRDLSPSQQVDQARYLVQSAVETLAAGADRHYWFSGAPYCANGFGCFGLFSGDFQPWPSYSAHAALASLLGRANYAHAVADLPEGARGHVFKDGGRAVTVLWADEPTPVTVAVHGDSVRRFDAMGAPAGRPALADGEVTVTASPDPTYLVSDGGAEVHARPTANDVRDRRHRPPTRVERIVLSQRFAAADAAPGKASGEAPPPHGYRLGRSTAMAVDVYNFDAVPRRVKVTAHAWGGWAVSGPQTVTVPAGGRVGVPFTIVAGRAVQRRVDYPLVFEATVRERAVPPSVSRIQRRGGRAGEPVELAPAIAPLAPSDGAVVSGPTLDVEAEVSDALSGVDPDTVVVEVDGERVASDFDPVSGVVTAQPHVDPGTHVVRIEARNRAHAASEAILRVTVE
jgi:hypothetical protein